MKEEIISDEILASGILIESQSDKKENLPKSLRPGVISDTEFKNIQITYKFDKAVIKWDKMDDEIVKFNIYRSKKPYSDKLPNEVSKKIATIKSSSFKNIYTDKSIKKGERYTYRIAAYNKDNKIVTTSIKLFPDQIFITKEKGDKSDFRKLTDKKFNRVFIYDNDIFEFTTLDRIWKIFIKPKFKSIIGGTVNVRFLNCSIKIDGSEICDETDEKKIEVFINIKPNPVNK